MHEAKCDSGVLLHICHTRLFAVPLHPKTDGISRNGCRHGIVSFVFWFFFYFEEINSHNLMHLRVNGVWFCMCGCAYIKTAKCVKNKQRVATYRA